MHTAQFFTYLALSPLGEREGAFPARRRCSTLTHYSFGIYATSRGGSRRLATGDPAGGTATAGDCFRWSTAAKRAGRRGYHGKQTGAKEQRSQPSGAGVPRSVGGVETFVRVCVRTESRRVGFEKLPGGVIRRWRSRARNIRGRELKSSILD